MKKRMVLIVAGVVGLLLLVGGGFFAYRAFFSSSGAEAGKTAEAEQGHGKEEAKAGHGKAEEPKAEGGHGEKKEGERGAAPPAEPAMGPTVALEPFVVNLSDPGRPRYAKLVVNLELDADAAAAELEGLKPKVRDSLIMLFSSKTSEEMITVGGKETLRNEMIRRLNALLTAGKVAEVYFTEFVVQ